MSLLTVLDVESTGLDWTKGDRIIEVSAQCFNIVGRARVTDWVRRFDPEGRRMNLKAEKVHRISAADLVGAEPFRLNGARIVRDILAKSSAVVSVNGEAFDLPFIAHELGLAGLEMPTSPVSFDMMKLGMWASYDSKPPSLGEICWALGVPYDRDQAHAARYDVDRTAACFWVAADRGLVDISDLLKADAA